MDHPRAPRYLRLFHWLYARRWQLLALFLGVLIPLWIFGALAEEILEQEVFAFDAPILLLMRRLATPWLDQFMLLCSRLGFAYGVVPLDILILLLLLGRRRWGQALFWALAVGGAALLNVFAKSAFGRVRPDLWVSIAPETSFSFPSGHAMASMALVAALVVLLWPTRWRWPTLALGGLFVALVGLSRVYLGVHYPSDILAGWTASLAWVAGLSNVLYGRSPRYSGSRHDRSNVRA
jgi:membrane-associated phospholipid phosphatase